MYNLYVWVIGFLFVIGSEQLEILISKNMSIYQVVIIMTGLVLMLLSPKKNA